MQNRTLIYGLVAIAILASTGAAFAQSETDRLREALRQAIAQTRTLEDERTALQSKLASAECDKANLKAQVEGAQAETKKAQKQYRDAVEEFNSRLAERDATLDKWKSAYEEAADVARAKDAERAKFETEATACEASVKSCRSKNTQLVKVDRELVRRKRRHPFRRQAGRARTADRGWARTSSKPAAGLYRQDPRPKGDRMRKVVNPQALRGEALHLAAPVALVVAVLSISAAALATDRVDAPCSNQSRSRTGGSAGGAYRAPSRRRAAGSRRPHTGHRHTAQCGRGKARCDRPRWQRRSHRRRNPSFCLEARRPRAGGARARPGVAEPGGSRHARHRLVLQEALAKKWEQQPAVAAQLQQVRDNAIAELYLQSVAPRPPADYPSEADIQKTYDDNRNAFIAPREFELAQIFVAAPRNGGGSRQSEYARRAARRELAGSQGLYGQHSRRAAAIWQEFRGCRSCPTGRRRRSTTCRWAGTEWIGFRAWPFIDQVLLNPPAMYLPPLSALFFCAASRKSFL